MFLRSSNWTANWWFAFSLSFIYFLNLYNDSSRLILYWGDIRRNWIKIQHRRELTAEPTNKLHWNYCFWVLILILSKVSGRNWQWIFGGAFRVSHISFTSQGMREDGSKTSWKNLLVAKATRKVCLREVRRSKQGLWDLFAARCACQLPDKCYQPSVKQSATSNTWELTKPRRKSWITLLPAERLLEARARPRDGISGNLCCQLCNDCCWFIVPLEDSRVNPTLQDYQCCLSLWCGHLESLTTTLWWRMAGHKSILLLTFIQSAHNIFSRRTVNKNIVIHMLQWETFFKKKKGSG